MHRFGHHPHPLLDRRGIVTGHVANAEAAAHVEIAHGMAEGPGQGQGIGEHRGQVVVGLEFEDLGADVGVEAGELGPGVPGELPEHCLQLVGVKAELAIEVAGLDVFVGVALDPRG